MRGLIAALAVGLCLWAPPTLASQFGDNAQFSPDGSRYAVYARDKPVIEVWDYSGWPATAPVMTSITVPEALANARLRQWRLLDDGSIWMVRGLRLTRYTAGEAPAVSAALTVLGPKLEGAFMGYGGKPEVFFLGSAGTTTYTQTRCTLGPQLLAEGDKACSAQKVLTNMPQPPYADSVTFLIGIPRSAQDYITNYYLETGADMWNGYHTVFSEGRVLGAFERIGVRSGEASEKSAATSLGQKYFYDDDGDNMKLFKVASNWTDPILVRGQLPVFTADGRYVFTKVKNGPPGEILVRDLTAALGSERKVTLDGVHELHVSPNGKFVIYGDAAKPLALQSLTDAYYGMTPKMVEDVLMQRVAVNLKAKKWDTALEAMAELEQHGGDAAGESFHFIQIDTLIVAGRKAEAQVKAKAFLSRYGEKSKHYKRMIEILAL